MGQTEILNLLKKTKKPMSAKEIAEALNYTSQKVCTRLNSLIKYREVFIKEITREEAMEKYNYFIPRRINLYYI